METTRGMRKQEHLQVTLGDLIVELIDETVQFVPDEKVAYALVAYILGDLLNNSRVVRTNGTQHGSSSLAEQRVG